MIILLSPAKNLNFDAAPDAPRATKPTLMSDTLELSETTRALTKAKIKSLMKLSDNLTALNHERFQAFEGATKGDSVKQAALAFNGDVYQGLDANSLNKDDLSFAQDHLRILSGLYGLLRPLDAIEPYRLEMGTSLQNPRGANLYDFWGDKISKEINKALKGKSDQTVVNLASNEYFSAVDKAALKAPVITPVFKDEKDGKLRVLSFYAKRARGAMARAAIENRVETADELKGLTVEGYRFSEDGSTGDSWLFTRKQPPKKG